MPQGHTKDRSQPMSRCDGCICIIQLHALSAAATDLVYVQPGGAGYSTINMSLTTNTSSTTCSDTIGLRGVPRYARARA